MKKLLLLSTLFLAFCSHEKPQAPAAETAGNTEKTSGDLIELSNSQIKTASISWGAAIQKTVADRLAVNGELRVHNENMATVSAFSDGILTELKTGLNKSVRKGDVIAVFRKPDLVDMQQDFLENRDRMRFLQAEYERYNSLKDENATALKNFQKADAEYRESQTRDQVLAAKLRMYQINPDKLTAATLRSELVLTAPVSGVITRTFVNVGSALQTGTPVCEIVDLSQLHADLFVFEKDLARIRVGQSVELQLQGSGQSVTGSIFSIDPTVDPEKRAIRAHVRLQAKPGQTLSNLSYVDGWVAMSNGTAKQSAVPAEAVVRETNENFVFALVKSEGEKVFFRKIPVQVLPAADGFLAITATEPLDPTLQFVLKGAYYVAAQGAGVSAEE